MPSVELYKDEKLMDGGRRRWSGIYRSLQSRMPSYDAASATKIRPLDHTASNMQRGFESTITFTGKYDERALMGRGLSSGASLV